MAHLRQEYQFDLKLAVDCASAYTVATGLGCTVADAAGAVLHESGLGCKGCGVCDAAGIAQEACACAHVWGMSEAERFGGKYIYFCPMGLTCFVSPIIGTQGSIATMTVGPFLMVDLEDYIAYDLTRRLSLPEAVIERVSGLVKRVPSVPPGAVNSLSTVLFMLVGYINNISAANRMIDRHELDLVQDQVTGYMLERKAEGASFAYPIKTEKNLIACIAESDKPKAQKLLNKLLGHIFFTSGDDLDRVKSKTYELLVMISRAAMDAGVSTHQAMRMNHGFWTQVQAVNSVDGLCVYCADIINRYIDNIFSLSEKKGVEVVQKAVSYMRRNYVKKITLEDTAKAVYLSPTYFSKVFQKSQGLSFNAYLNRLRVEKSKQLLGMEQIRLADIAAMVGFEDQSYFTKVFTRIVGTTPGNYRKANAGI